MKKRSIEKFEKLFKVYYDKYDCNFQSEKNVSLEKKDITSSLYSFYKTQVTPEEMWRSELNQYLRASRSDPSINIVEIFHDLTETLPMIKA